MSKKIKIPKNKDIEEFVEECGNTEKIESMNQVIEKMNNRRQEFKKNIKVSKKQSIERKVQNYCNRRDAESADEQRRIAYLKAMDGIEEAQSEK